MALWYKINYHSTIAHLVESIFGSVSIHKGSSPLPLSAFFEYYEKSTIEKSVLVWCLRNRKQFMAVLFWRTVKTLWVQ